jgi:hypothetical protein
MFRTIWRAASATTVIAAILVSSALAGADRQAGSSLSGPYLGSYRATLTADQAASRGDVRMTGAFRLVLRRNSTYSAWNPLDGRVDGRVAALPGRRLRFYADSGCVGGGFERPRGGTYRWSLNGRKLTFRLVSEGPCTGRTQTLTYPVWSRL